MSGLMLFIEARALNIADASTDDLARAWHAYASAISYHHADDSGKEWGAANALMPRAREIELALRERGAPRPTGDYLMSANDRINWETGEWSQGWHWKANAAAQVRA